MLAKQVWKWGLLGEIPIEFIDLFRLFSTIFIYQKKKVLDLEYEKILQFYDK